MPIKNLRRIYVDVAPRLSDRIDTIVSANSIRRTPFLRNLVYFAIGNEEVLTEAIEFTRDPHQSRKSA